MIKSPEYKNLKLIPHKNKYRYLKDYKWVNPLTICIASISNIASPYPKIVFCADRLISAGIQFEHGVPKIKDLREGAYVMVASSDALKSDNIVENVKNMIKGKKLKIKEIVSLFSEECMNQLKDCLEKDVLFKYGLSYKDFIKKSKEVSQDLLRIISNEIYTYEYKFRTEFIILGFDFNPYIPHLYVVNQHGNYNPHDFIGFATTGSGSSLAFSEMTKYTYHPNIPLGEALVRVYNSKKVAEGIGGVGKYTDLLVLHMAKKKDSDESELAIWEVSDKAQKILDAGIEEMHKKEEKTYVDIINKLDEFFKEAEKESSKEVKKS